MGAAMRALVVENSRRMSAHLVRMLEELGLVCDTAADGESGCRCALAEGEDLGLVLVGFLLPKLSGLELVRRLRSVGCRVPLVLVGDLKHPGDRICGLDMGADECVSVPFVTEERAARVRALLRRAAPGSPGGRLVVRDLCVDRLARKAVRGGRPVPLTPREDGILECLARQTGRAVPARRILEEVWGYDVSPPTTVVETRVCLLRRKLSANGEDEIIHTVRGFGYMLK